MSALAYDVTQEHFGAQYRVTGSYEGSLNIRVYRNGDEVLAATCDGYRIWNYVAHLRDIAREIEQARAGLM